MYACQIYPNLVSKYKISYSHFTILKVHMGAVAYPGILFGKGVQQI